MQVCVCVSLFVVLRGLWGCFFPEDTGPPCVGPLFLLHSHVSPLLRYSKNLNPALRLAPCKAANAHFVSIIPLHEAGVVPLIWKLAVFGEPHGL